ncbi:type I restriction endonuclease [Alterisphingorhabdus coralli]|uniref:Type I restriction endonuclease n=1 Tax=Alterisphingorhabdus coralli TaxID=3071408 RepID=A0AA97I0N0_9SPHN|nr:type I restriction endonuclease [Parasphingorhabdus sp. SCSIO 66989]WOE75152.1 type I restriction endonuclease [Parasphingorhabdus sp. SCSIO 66989]
MEIESSMTELRAKLKEHKEILETEESAKTSLILPFLRALGYDIFNPSEVKAEFTADVGTKKGEKVDYALCVDGEVVLLVECKPVTNDLSIKHANQLFRYFTATTARVALLTNGKNYEFYTDSDRTNMMDESPFFTFDLESHTASDLKQLAAFKRADFDVERIVEQAGHLKLQTLVTKELRKELSEPSDDFVRTIASRLHDGSVTEAVRNRFKPVITQSISALIREGVNERLRNAMQHGEEGEPALDESEVASDGIETTEVEMEGYQIVRAICAKSIDPSRVVIRDAKSYCAILMDNNNRKTIARLHFNSATSRHIGLFSGKAETRQAVDSPMDIYKYSDDILSRITELDT